MFDMEKLTVMTPEKSCKINADISSFVSSLTLPVSKNPRYFVFPGFCDVHVHFREPGFSYKETIASGTYSAAAGGYTAVCTMPNLLPVPDCLENLQKQIDIIDRDAVIKVYPYGSITVGERGMAVSDMEGMADSTVAFSDDGRGVQDDSVMEEAMLRAKSLNKLIVAHCEDNSLLNGGYIHDGVYCSLHNHKGISSESEYKQISRDLNLVAKTGCSYHVCHISAKESVDLIRNAKKSGLDVTCETAPHYLVLDENDLQENGRFKMNPPLRSADDRIALIEGILDGTIDMIATDHAPHSQEEKSRGLKDSLFGVVGLETAFPVLYTKLVKNGIISLEKLLPLFYTNPVKRFKLEEDTGFSIWDLNTEYTVTPDDFKSFGRATPFDSMNLYGKCLYTVYKGKTVYSYID